MLMNRSCYDFLAGPSLTTNDDRRAVGALGARRQNDVRLVRLDPIGERAAAAVPVEGKWGSEKSARGRAGRHPLCSSHAAYSWPIVIAFGLIVWMCTFSSFAPRSAILPIAVASARYACVRGPT